MDHTKLGTMNPAAFDERRDVSVHRGVSVQHRLDPVVGLGQLGGKLCSADVQKNDNSAKMAASGGKDILWASPPEISRDKILSDFPLHWHVWHKDSSSLEEELALNKVCIRAYFVYSVLTARRGNRRHVLCNTINGFSICLWFICSTIKSFWILAGGHHFIWRFLWVLWIV